MVNSKIVIDEGKKLPGRGAWLHAKTVCLQLALSRKAFGRAFKQQFAVAEQELTQAIEQAEAMMAKNE